MDLLNSTFKRNELQFKLPKFELNKVYSTESFYYLKSIYDVKRILFSIFEIYSYSLFSDMSHNKLQSIYARTFDKLFSLKRLILSDNLITYIEEGAFKSLEALQYL